MSKCHKDAVSPKQKPEPAGQGDAPKDVARLANGARAWASVNKLPGNSQKIDARRKLPSGPLGGSGRKSNLSRSS